MEGWTRRKQRRLLKTLVLPPRRKQFNIEDFLSDLADVRGRQIRLLYQPLGQESVACGLWIATSVADYIVVDPETPRTLREHIVLHETAHMLLGHGGLPSIIEEASYTVLDPQMVQRVLARTTYDTPEERDAEALATYLGIKYVAAASWTERESEAAVLNRFARAVSDGPWHG